eukprot:12288549-Karenia_brevis.AAC.1
MLHGPAIHDPVKLPTGDDRQAFSTWTTFIAARVNTHTGIEEGSYRPLCPRAPCSTVSTRSWDRPPSMERSR